MQGPLVRKTPHGHATLVRCLVITKGKRNQCSRSSHRGSKYAFIGFMIWHVVKIVLTIILSYSDGKIVRRFYLPIDSEAFTVLLLHVDSDRSADTISHRSIYTVRDRRCLIVWQLPEFPESHYIHSSSTSAHRLGHFWVGQTILMNQPSQPYPPGNR